MSQSLRVPRQRRVAPLRHGVRPMAPVLAVRPHSAGDCFNCGGFPSVSVRIDGQLHTVDCAVCTSGVTR